MLGVFDREIINLLVNLIYKDLKFFLNFFLNYIGIGKWVLGCEGLE